MENQAENQEAHEPRPLTLKPYIGTKVLKARAMTRGSYNEYRGWNMPENENPNDEGYLVEYIDGGEANDPRHAGYISWSPKGVFEDAYRPSGAMNFGHALEMLKRGRAVSRSGWNGKGMFLYLVPAPEQGYPAQTGVAKAYFGDDALVAYGPYIAMKTADVTLTMQEVVVPWLCSQTDALAEDWGVVDFGK